MKFILCFGLFLILFLTGKGQNDSIKDSLVTPSIYTFKDFCIQDSCETGTIDTTLFNFHRYNIEHRLFYNLGNLGAAHQSLIFIPQTHIGFQFRENPYTQYLYKQPEQLYYNTKRPFTQAFIIVGSAGEQLLNVLHTQNIMERWNFSVKANRIASAGFYQNQRTSVSSFSLSSNYLSYNNKYSVMGGIIINRLKAEENGGLISGLTEEDLIFSDRRTLPVNINTAFNRYRSNELFVTQYFNFFKAAVDSLLGKPIGNISYKFKYKDENYAYWDESVNQDFYPNIFQDHLITQDSTGLQKFENEVGWNGTAKNFNYYGGVNHEIINIYNQNKEDKDSVLFNTIPGVGLGWQHKNYKWFLNGNYIAAGNNRNDYKISTGIDILLFRKINYEFSYLSQLRSPDYFFTKYFSNHYQWRNDFDKTNITQIQLKLGYLPAKIKAGATLTSLKNYIYFNTDAMPAQLEGSNYVQQVFLEKKFAYKSLHFDNRFVLQNVNNDVIRVPNFISQQSIYLNNRIFKNALEILTGFDLLYWSEYKSYNYSPALSSFYLQNDIKTGNYPYISFFFTMKVKRLRAFLRIDHANEGLTGYDFYTAPYYPARGRTYKVGINWIFLD